VDILKTYKTFFFFVFFTFAMQASAQYRSKERYLEAGFLFGATNYSGDLAERSIELVETKPGYGVYLRYQFSRHFAVRGHAYSGAISGDDRHSPDLKSRSFRFSTSLLELGAVGEYAFIAKDRYSKTGIHHFHISPYVYAGGGLNFITQEAEYYGPADQRNEILVVPLPENDLEDRLLVVPMGVGLRFDLLERMVFGVEFGWRPVFSDDLDGVRLNGNPDKGDWYYFTGATVAFVLNAKRR
jgi:Domain of unknown function (DUF6089)